jgi:peptidyl-dipeptidase Dcp
MTHIQALSSLGFGLAVLALSCAHPTTRGPRAEATMSAPDPTGNPLLADFDTPFNTPPFSRFQEAHYLPAFAAAMARHREEIQAIVDNPQAPSFENTLEALDRSGALLTRVAMIFFGLASANTNDQMDQIAQQVAPMLAKHQDDILLNPNLFARVQAVHKARAEAKLTPEQQTLLEETYQNFVRGGAELDAVGQAELRKINEKLSVIRVQFGQNVRKEDNAFALTIEDRADLAGLPERVVQAAEKAAAERGQAGKWVFTLHKPSLIPFLQSSQRRALRKAMLEAYLTRGAHGDERDNREILKQIVLLRTAKAKLLGYATWADFVLTRRMAKRPAAVAELLGRLWKAALPVARREARELQALLAADDPEAKLAAWDWWYYAEKLRKARYDLDENELRPYFKLENVIQGVFDVATRLYGIRFMARDDIPLYHPDVKTFEVQEADGSLVGILYVDYFPRASKRGGAWCGGFRQTVQIDGQRVAPLVNNVGNFSMPTADKPSLLSFEEVSTLFHEFGHALQALLLETTYAATGEEIKVDFVELPSQIMENWAVEPEVLRMYARHYQTGEPIPDALIEKIRRSRTFNQGFETTEYLAASLLDMDWHSRVWTEEQVGGLDVLVFEKESLGRIGLIPEIEPRYRSPHFQHIFSSDFYAAGYYSYIWAAVLDADAFDAFRQAGLFDAETAQAFRRHILSKGGAEDPAEL